MLTFLARDTGSHNLVYANADLTKASQNREVIASATTGSTSITVEINPRAYSPVLRRTALPADTQHR